MDYLELNQRLDRIRTLNWLPIKEVLTFEEPVNLYAFQGGYLIKTDRSEGNPPLQTKRKKMIFFEKANQYLAFLQKRQKSRQKLNGSLNYTFKNRSRWKEILKLQKWPVHCILKTIGKGRALSRRETDERGFGFPSPLPAGKPKLFSRLSENQNHWVDQEAGIGGNVSI